MQITKDLIYVGVNDHKLDLFEGQYEVPLGMAYNSYLIKDEKIVVMDSVEKGFAGEGLLDAFGYFTAAEDCLRYLEEARHDL